MRTLQQLVIFLTQLQETFGVTAVKIFMAIYSLKLSGLEI